MSSRVEIAIYGLKDDAHALEQAARVVRRRMKKPAGVSLALFCRTLTTEAAEIRAEIRQLETGPGD